MCLWGEQSQNGNSDIKSESLELPSTEMSFCLQCLIWLDEKGPRLHRSIDIDREAAITQVLNIRVHLHAPTPRIGLDWSWRSNIRPQKVWSGLCSRHRRAKVSSGRNDIKIAIWRGCGTSVLKLIKKRNCYASFTFLCTIFHFLAYLYFCKF